MSNCPNCGAPITGPVCEYCGTSFRGLRATVPGIIDDACDIPDAAKIIHMLDKGLITANEARKMMRLEHRKEIENALKGPYVIKW